MSVTLYDATIKGSLILTSGTTVVVSADFDEVNDQAFTISSGTATLFVSTGSAASVALTDLTVSVTTGIRSSKRTSVTLNASDTTPLVAGQYHMIWSLVLGDSQTRKVKQSIQIRTVA